MKSIIFTVTNSLHYDQRMIRICTSLSQAGYTVTLVGIKDGEPLEDKVYAQKRLSVWFQKGPAFYIAYNLRLFWWLLFAKCDAICAIDLDTILPVWLAAKLRGKQRVYDAHEYFSQQKEVVTRGGIYKIWHGIERKFIPKFKYGYTVSQSIADSFKQVYGADYIVIRNMPLLKPLNTVPDQTKRTILYQGAVNEARGLEFLIPAMKEINAILLIYGDGNFTEQVKTLITANNLQDKVLLKGKLLPDELDAVTKKASIGINLVEYIGLNQYYSLANKFFDYMHNAVPQVTMNFPEYKTINDHFEVALLIDDLQIRSIINAVEQLLTDKELYHRLQQNCLAAREKLNWQEEEKKLKTFYDKIFTLKQ